MVLLASMLVGCASRAPQSPDATAPTTAGLEERKALELIGIWRGDLAAYLQRGQGEWSTRLSQLRDLRTRRGPRPGRIVFASLAAGGDIRRADAWDVTGLLLGRQTLGGRHWYLFIVGIVERKRYRPVTIRDMRLVALSSGGALPDWRLGAAYGESLERYRHAYTHQRPVRFPAADDGYRIETAGYQVSVRERRSGAEWTLLLTAGG